MSAKKPIDLKNSITGLNALTHNNGLKVCPKTGEGAAKYSHLSPFGHFVYVINGYLAVTIFLILSHILNSIPFFFKKIITKSLIIIFLEF